MNSTTDKRLKSFLVNDDFINYVLNPNLILQEMWEEFINTHPQDLPAFQEAIQILHGELKTKALSNEEVSRMEHTIFKKCGLTYC